MPATCSCERRRPEETTLYKIVQEQLETFLAHAEVRTGAGLPVFVKDEFEAFLECGILAHGFLRVRNPVLALRRPALRNEYLVATTSLLLWHGCSVRVTQGRLAFHLLQARCIAQNTGIVGERK